ncbi:benzoate 4-monooxygenase cytochrome P450 [Lophiostoma macrostomum CBS 122681]|uniref:Benzoate 4-monooxygenase cytochrome P450 n=1 Tax=Lophiostoma macrostomum CBS 122681 TaxID=1314788 RepID=A0A6A6TDZ0_9PLEO|nr:benzoate 4-monooxygenase cytochrome P450 [Lophiostoma macrostomum CBS 122681]
MAQFIAFAVCLGFSYLFGTTLDNLLFHPLGKTPGPLLARINSLPSFYHACKGDRHVWIWQNFEIYGPKFRAAPNLILFNSVRAHNDIYGTRANTFRSSFYRAWKRSEDEIQTMSSDDHASHTKMRKLLNLIFTEQSLRAWSPIVSRNVDRWIELLTGTSGKETEGWSQPVDMATSVDMLMFDIVGELCFGQTFNTKQPGENDLKKLPRLIMNMVTTGYKIGKSPLLTFFLFLRPRGLNKLLERAQKKEVEQYKAFTQIRVDERLATRAVDTSEAKHQDMLNSLLSAIDPDTNELAYTNQNHLLSEVRLLVLTSTDTTASTLCGLFFYLAHNPRVLAKATAEVRATFESAEEIVHGAKLSGCKYLRACSDEALRLTPPAPGELPREVLPGGAMIDGHHYPAGTVVGCSPWAMGRDESIYGDANFYRPERWLPSDDPRDFYSAADVLKLKKAHHPFSIGLLNCAGQNLALLELSLITARLLWAVDMRVAPGQNVGQGREELGWGQRSARNYVVKDAWLCLKEGPVLQFRVRMD